MTASRSLAGDFLCGLTVMVTWPCGLFSSHLEVKSDKHPRRRNRLEFQVTEHPTDRENSRQRVGWRNRGCQQVVRQVNQTGEIKMSSRYRNSNSNNMNGHRRAARMGIPPTGRADEQQPPSCPECGNDSVARILYGLMVPSSRLSEELRARRVVCAGCVVRDEQWKCNRCDFEF